jgi:hypothetical protein
MSDENELAGEWRRGVSMKLEHLATTLDDVKTTVVRLEAEKLDEKLSGHDERLTRLEHNWTRLFAIWGVIQIGVAVIWAIFTFAVEKAPDGNFGEEIHALKELIEKQNEPK